MDDVQAAWLAGLYEGEGTLAVFDGSKYRSGNGIRIRMTDEDVIRRCFEVTGVGSVTGPTVRPPPRKPTWMWAVYNRTDLLYVLTAIRPHLLSRRGARADEALLRLGRGDLRRATDNACGTPRGYKRHRGRQEPQCPECLTAWSEWCKSARAKAATRH